jgi:energy-coupling factor transport system ATP-binding protein
VVALVGGALSCDAPPRAFLEWAAASAPALQTPAARLLARAGLRPPPSGVKEARATLRAQGLVPEPGPPAARTATPRPPRGAAVAVRAKGLWFEWPRGRAALRSVDLALAAGERVALMGRNGAGKSTLLRCLAGLREPTRGKVQRSGRVALLLQNPGDYLLHDRVGDELPLDALRAAGLEPLAARHPRDLSGGERQRLALAIVSAGSEPPAAIALDEPTRGMDRAEKGDLADRLRERAAAGAAVLVATHDVEFAAAVADRVVLLGDGVVVADGRAAEVLSGGWYFATETARVLGGAGGALLPEEGAALLRERLSLEVRP